MTLNKLHKINKRQFFSLLVACATLIGAIAVVQSNTNLFPRAKNPKAYKSHTYNFQEGWNAISIPLMTDAKASSMCSSLPNMISIAGWDTSSHKYIMYDCSYPTLYDDYSLNPYEGYFVYLNSEGGVWTVTGTNTSPVQNYVVGGNFVGFKERKSKFMASDVCKTLNNQRGLEPLSIRKYNNYQFESYGCNPALNPDFEIEEGVGYFVGMQERETPNPGFRPNLPDTPPGLTK